MSPDAGPAFDEWFAARASADVRVEFSSATIDQDRFDRMARTPRGARQRAAVAAGTAAAVGGLVSVPTSPEPLAATRSEAEAEALRRAMRATAADKRRARIAKLRRAVGFTARAIGAAVDRPGFRARYVAMLTLTYRHAEDWQPKHVSRLLDEVRRYLKDQGHSVPYVWVGELQARGAIHYHIALWLPAGVTIPKPDACGWWPHGSTNIVAARAAVPYLLKYMSKAMHFDGFPKGARIHGSGGVEHAMRRARRWLGLPSFVKSRSDVFDSWKRATGGGWIDPDGVVVPSEFERAWIGDRWSCIQVANYGRPFEADGPFSWLTRKPEVTK